MSNTDHIEELLFDNIPEHIWLGDRNTITQRRRELAQRLAAALVPAEQELRDLLHEVVIDYHYLGLIKDHHDPSADGWVVGGIETCRDPLCVASLAAIERGTLHPYETPERGHEPAPVD